MHRVNFELGYPMSCQLLTAGWNLHLFILEGHEQMLLGPWVLSCPSGLSVSELSVLFTWVPTQPEILRGQGPRHMSPETCWGVLTSPETVQPGECWQRAVQELAGATGALSVTLSAAPHGAATPAAPHFRAPLAEHPSGLRKSFSSGKILYHKKWGSFNQPREFL